MATSVSTQFTPPSASCIGSTRKRKAEGQKTSAVLKKKTASIDDVADTYLNGLYALWDHLQTSTDLKIKLKEVADLGIRHQNLDMSANNPQATQTTFFVPMDKKEVQDYPPEKDQPETDDLLKTYYGGWPPKFSFVSDADHAVNRSNADCLCGTFEVAFGYLRRKKVGDSDSQTFQERKGWRAVYVSRTLSAFQSIFSLVFTLMLTKLCLLTVTTRKHSIMKVGIRPTSGFNHKIRNPRLSGLRRNIHMLWLPSLIGTHTTMLASSSARFESLFRS